MAARDVPTYLLREALDEAEAECTLERYQTWFPKEIARELRAVSNPKADKWDVFGNRVREWRYKEACQERVKLLWESHRRCVRGRVERMINEHLRRHGDYMLMQLGGSLEDFLANLMADHAAKRCPCFMKPKVEAMRQAREAWEGQQDAHRRAWLTSLRETADEKQVAAAVQVIMAEAAHIAPPEQVMEMAVA